jgi:hypothetical protein
MEKRRADRMKRILEDMGRDTPVHHVHPENPVRAV